MGEPKLLKGDIKYMEEQRIKLEINNDGVITIRHNDEIFMEINASETMEISAEAIFNSLDYKVGTRYKLEMLSNENEKINKHKYEALIKLHDFYNDLII